jgi:hypothetical protein
VAELAELADARRLPALEVPDEVPAEAVAVLRVLPLEVLCPVLADDLDAGLGQRRHVVDGHVLRGCDDRDLRAELCADAVVALPDRVRRCRQAPPAGP